MGRVSWAIVLLCGCGARTALDVPDVHDAAPPMADVSAPPSIVPCAARDYTTTALDSASFQLVGGRLYFKTSSSLVRADTESGEVDDVLASVADAFVVDATYVWWVGAGNHLQHAANEGGAIIDGPCAAPNMCPIGFGHAASVVGVTDDVVVTADLQNILYVLPKSGGGPTLLVPNGSPTASVAVFVHDGPRVFWMTDEWVFEAVVGASAKPDLDEGWPTGLALHEQDVFWTSFSNKAFRLVHRATSGGATSVLYTGELHGPLGANASYVYGLASGGVTRVSIVTGESTVIAPNVLPTKMIVDGACIYTIEKGGAVRRRTG